MRRTLAVLTLSGATAVTGLVLAAPVASATDATTTAVTSVSGTQFHLSDDDGSPGVEVKGTSNGDATGQFDVRCYYTDSSNGYAEMSSTSSPPPKFAADGSFDVFVTLQHASASSCVVRAIPRTGSTPTTPSDFSATTGKLLYIAENSPDRYDSSTPSGGRTYDYYVAAPQTTAFADYGSAGSCGIDDANLTDASGSPAAVPVQSDYELFCNAWFRSDDTVTSPTTVNQRGGIKLDGVEAYTSDTVESLNPYADVPGMSYTVTHDPSNGNVVIAESTPLLTCSSATFPPSDTSCATFNPTGVRLDRIIAQGSSGRVITIRDTFVSTDGKAHSLSLQYENNYKMSGTGFKAPGGSTFATHAIGDVLPAPAAGPGTLETINDPTTAASFDNPVTSLTWSSAPSGFLFRATNQFFVTYAKSVPAAGSAVLTQTYSQGTTTAEVDGYADAATTGYRSAIKVALSPLLAVTGTRLITVKGTFSGGANSLPTSATVAVGTTSVTAPVAADGTFSAPVTLAPGANAIAVVGTDDGVIKAVASTQVTYADPVTGSGSKVTRTKSSKTKKVTKVTVSLTLTCAFYGPSGGCPVKVTDTPKGFKTLTKNVIVPVGGKVTVTLTAASSTVKKVAGLKKGKHLDSALTATYTDPAGGTFSVTKKTLRLA